MKILVLSDSHSGLSFMRDSIHVLQPEHVIHLGDYVVDAEAIASEYPEIQFHMVAGNCDRWRNTDCSEILIRKLNGHCFYMTHGHLQNVKLNREQLIKEGRKACAEIILYGHTHCAECRQLEDGIWLMNPGACGAYSGSVGLITIEPLEIPQCRVLCAADLEAYR